MKAWLENTSYLGRQWLRVFPTEKPYQLTDPEGTEALRSRLLIPCRPPNTPCTYCGVRPKLGHEDLCRGANRGWISRHNQVTRAFVRTLSSRADLQVEEEPRAIAVATQDSPRTPRASSSPSDPRDPSNPSDPSDPSELRADFSVLIGSSRYHYDVQIVAINKDSARENPYSTLTEAADAKRRKYKALGAFFHPLIFSSGGLMEKDIAKAYKGL